MKRTALIVAISLAAVALGYAIGMHRATSPAAFPAAHDDKRILYWYDPMIPAEHHDKPGLSSMGMTMIPKYADAGGNDVAGVHIDAATRQNLALRTAVVERRVLDETIRVPGTVGWDLDDAQVISARADGIVTRLIVRAPYTAVARHAPIAELTAPAWAGAIAEDRALADVQSADARALHAASRQRLLVLGVDGSDARASGRDGAVALRAPQAGVVTDIAVKQGQRVDAGQTIATIQGLDRIWIDAAVPQAQAGRVGEGTPVTVTLDATPGEVYQARVQTLLPDLDPLTRTQHARIVLDNPAHRLSPGMFATVTLHARSGEAMPMVPDDAIVGSGNDSSRIIVQEPHGRFQPRVVHLGRSAGGYTEVLSGLQGGERIVVSGQFLIDSEASLSGALERLDDAAPAAPASTALPMETRP